MCGLSSYRGYTEVWRGCGAHLKDIHALHHHWHLEAHASDQSLEDESHAARPFTHIACSHTPSGAVHIHTLTHTLFTHTARACSSTNTADLFIHIHCWPAHTRAHMHTHTLLACSHTQPIYTCTHTDSPCNNTARTTPQHHTGAHRVG